ncbi:hypothetical protein DPMN_040396 [Dreissena polymorpha]|uniref:Uncharacterized protein n=1 Tax=Dreissena polymorpha TaxID=45954 RepID=A0A9D4HUZ7_DREPO|nr:hypothetical protein DPMN_040396 [Dreissena polymorpha]
MWCLWRPLCATSLTGSTGGGTRAVWVALCGVIALGMDILRIDGEADWVDDYVECACFGPLRMWTQVGFPPRLVSSLSEERVTKASRMVHTYALPSTFPSVHHTRSNIRFHYTHLCLQIIIY